MPDVRRLRYRASCKIMSEAFSAIMMIGALVLPDIRSGMTEASTTRKASMPRTRKPLIDHGERIVAHPAGRGRMIDRAAALRGSNPATSSSLVTFVAGIDLLDHIGLERRRMPESFARSSSLRRLAVRSTSVAR